MNPMNAPAGVLKRRSSVPRHIANGRFEIRKTLGVGCFGKVYSAVHTETKEQVAVKCENLSTGALSLQTEVEMLKLLRSPEKPQGFAEHYYFGKEGTCQILVMEFLGHDLEERLQACGGKFQVKTTVLIAEQMLERFEYLHSRGIVHQDVKPENFLWGVKGRRHHLYLVDFGLSKKYYARRHVQMRQHRGLIGTARYASINAHHGLEQSRRDDLEAVGYLLVYLLRGALPWSGLQARCMSEKLRRILKYKESIGIDELCSSLPRQLYDYLTYCRGLSFKDRPDYAMLKGLFSDLRAHLGKLAGRPVEDADLEWISGKDRSNLVPLELGLTHRQPDEWPERRLFNPCFCAAKVHHSVSDPEQSCNPNAKLEESQEQEQSLAVELDRIACVGGA